MLNSKTYDELALQEVVSAKKADAREDKAKHLNKAAVFAHLSELGRRNDQRNP